MDYCQWGILWNQRKNTTMKPNLLMAIILPLFVRCQEVTHERHQYPTPLVLENNENPYPSIANIPLPNGYTRLAVEENSFAHWLRQLSLKKDRTVYLFDGRVKENQSAQFAVIDISTGKKDLQQCADAVMRLRAEYLYEQKRFSEILFQDNAGTPYRPPLNSSRKEFDIYLEKVFTWCGTISLSSQLKTVEDIAQVMPGEVFIRGGSPGHAAIVMDVATDAHGQKIFLLANSYMPAQDMHLVVNPGNEQINPWFSATKHGRIRLPEWSFSSHELKRW